MQMPLSTFVGTLRQISPSSLGASEKAILQACAPHFLPLSDEERERWFDAQKSNIDPNVAWVFVPSRPHRRYSGDFFSDFMDEYRLDFGSYYSVCIRQSGFDNGTLAAELNAYRSTDVDFLVFFFDGFDETLTSRLGLPGGAHIGVFVTDPSKLVPHVPKDAPEELRQILQQAVDSGVAFYWSVHTDVSEARIEGVLDLRQLDAQEWFFQTFVPQGFTNQNAREFADILPELLQQDLGGSPGSNMRLQAIGAYLRDAGVNSLIYPSARNDVGVAYQDGVPVRWRGWNLVRYRGRRSREGKLMDFGGWETTFRNGVICSKKQNPEERTRSWYVAGQAALNLLRYEKTMERRGVIL